MTSLRLDEIVDTVKLFSRGSPILAMAFTGSRPIGIARRDSDHDFVVVTEDDLPPGYRAFKMGGASVDALWLGKKSFEDQITANNPPFSVGPKMVHFPYKPIIGSEYLSEIESQARKKLLNEFISSLPIGQEVVVSPERITEWPLISQAISWPIFIWRLFSVVDSSRDILGPITQKNITTASQLGYEQDVNGDYHFVNPGSAEPPQPKDLLGSLVAKSIPYVTNVEKLTVPQIVYGALFTTLMAPQTAYETMYRFPRFQKEGNALRYVGPDLEGFCRPRRKFAPLLRIAGSARKALHRSTEKYDLHLVHPTHQID